jgi:ABC-2 type transport system ATP-binding protein
MYQVSMNAIEVVNVTKVYEKPRLGRTYRTTGVKDISLSVREGEIFGLLGLNGSGKTTTIKLILGLLKPTTGEVHIQGKRLPDTDILKQIGYLPEVPYFYRYLTAFEILKFYGKLSELDRIGDRVEKIIDMVGLTAWKDKRLAEFSKGMLQRIGLAQSLLHDPAILVYDEPVSGLDPLAVQEMRNLILKMKDEGKTVFLSSHLISEVERICDRVAILAKGSLVRVIEQKEWASKEGELERIFIDDVAGSSEMGRIKT